jgi:RNA polymerase sigma-70 factor (ECF subfamily)
VVAAATTAAVVLVLTGTNATVSASAARVLHQAAGAARRERSAATLASGQYLYTKSVDAYMATTAGTRPDGTTWQYSALVPHVREIWLAADGSGWLHETDGKPTFLSERDRQDWIADGRPSLGARESDTRLGGGPANAQMPSLDLPSDPEALYARLHHQAEGNGNGVYPEMFTLIGDALRENSTTPAQRAALYEVAARLPGIELVGRTTDATGRPAIGIAMENGHDDARSTLLFDPHSFALLGEEQVLLPGNGFGYPAGTVVGLATYVDQKVVDSVPASVVNAAKD